MCGFTVRLVLLEGTELRRVMQCVVLLYAWQ